MALLKSGKWRLFHIKFNCNYTFFREIPLKTVIYTAPSVKIKALTVGEAIKEKFNDFIEMTSDERPESGEVKLHMGIYYHCNDVWNPQVGDIRVQFYYAGLTNEPVSLTLCCDFPKQ